MIRGFSLGIRKEAPRASENVPPARPPKHKLISINRLCVLLQKVADRARSKFQWRVKGNFLIHSGKRIWNEAALYWIARDKCVVKSHFAPALHIRKTWKKYVVCPS